mmetsp:Transcript_707/g.4526  ORF Transcript_707/g.4526 Transcript_707/m.4526 type:complete len:223 (-) Transcript_707:3000-3668(-)|eukprot:CAMPEP_0183824842 /NCGR_PEP_ID=MMETSP0807_2-20130328/804_1 /TAXON_ID=88271 /ORGANISM="Picocystis salinarum, Strain CCMP1897" /LENGTH=222 /DNA_ID=CAMNT_0026069795 /DNA_START=255 /DNA_END=923 /DNA_ORIENTATION=-
MATTDGAGEHLARASPRCFVVVHAVSKSHNVGTIARCATAFDVEEVWIVGSDKYRTFGSHGAADHVRWMHAPTLEEAKSKLQALHGACLCGVEIVDEAKPIQEQPFVGSTAFLLGNEGEGLTEKEKNLCDQFVYIPQYGKGTASLNVAVAASIVLHHFAVWAGYQEANRQQHKYVVGPKPMRRGRRGVVCGPPEEIAQRRKERDARRLLEDTAEQEPYLELF